MTDVPAADPAADAAGDPAAAADGPPLETVAADPDALPRPEEEVADAVRDTPVPASAQPAAGGTDGGTPVQGDGAPDSY